MLSDVLLRAGWAAKILFLADRTKLVSQAKGTFSKVFQDTYSLASLLEQKKGEDPATSRIVFSTYPSMLHAIDGRRRADGSRLFTPGFFDLIILDESHRSIYNKYQEIFDYFDAMRLGLTATPKDDMDHNTYAFFDLPDGEPTYYFGYEEAVEGKYLVDYETREYITERMKEGVKYEALSEADREEYERTFGTVDGAERIGGRDIRPELFNKTVFNRKTIELVLERLMEEGIHVDDGDKLGKSIIFAKNHRHAEAIAERFRAMYPELGDDFITVIDYQVKYSDKLIDTFADPSKRPQIAISVDKLDTGIDIPEVVNLVFFKVVQSYSKFWQMIGRGTRLCDDLFGKGRRKERFLIFDWGGNFAFFSLPEHRGSDGKATPSLTARIFSLKGWILHLLHESGEEALQVAEGAPAYGADIKSKAALFSSLASDMRETVAAIDRESFVAKNHVKTIKKYAAEGVWESLSKEEAQEVERELAPLIAVREAEDVQTRRFDALLLSLIAARLSGKAADAGEGRLLDTVKKLREPRLRTIPAVKEKAAFLGRLATGGAIAQANAVELENIRRELRTIVQFIDMEPGPVYYTDFTDEKIDLPASGPILSPKPAESYQEKVKAYLKEHGTNIAIHKLHTNIPLTETDVKELERIFWQELGTEAEYRASYEDKPLGKLVRSIVGVDRAVLEAAFSRFLQTNTLTATQMDFLETLLGYIAKNGYLENPGAAFKAEPFKTYGGISKLFKTPAEKAIAKDIMGTVREITENAGIA